jgi:hypothetical protein
MNNNANSIINQIMAFKQQGMTPQAVAQMMFQQNPQLKMYQTQLQNMAGGKNPQEFVMQLARQNGVSQENLQAMQNMFGGKK